MKLEISINLEFSMYFYNKKIKLEIFFTFDIQFIRFFLMQDRN